METKNSFSLGILTNIMVIHVFRGETLDVFLHREAVYGVSVSPASDSVFASAGEDGRVLLYDMREPAAVVRWSFRAISLLPNTVAHQVSWQSYFEGPLAIIALIYFHDEICGKL